MNRVGVLALQGDVTEHLAVIEVLGASAVPVRRVADMDGIDALVLPGGESTAIGMLMESAGLREPIGKAIADGMPVLGTCAGMIMLASTVLDGRPDQEPLSVMDISVRRNGYGRQVASFETDVEVAGIGGGPMHAVFIRAPRVERAGNGVEVLARTADGSPVVCRDGQAVACSFHPELSGDGRLHGLILSMV